MSDFGNMQPHFDQNGGLVEFGDDSKLFKEFVQRAVPDEAASKEFSRPITRSADYIRIRQPGERDEIFRPAHDLDRRRFKREWDAYVEGKQALPEGTPLSVLFPVNPEIVENLKFDKIFVVEQLAALSDTQIQNIGMGGRMWTEKAKAYLAAATKGGDYQALAKKVAVLEAADAGKDEQIKALQDALDEATKKNRSKPAA